MNSIGYSRPIKTRIALRTRMPRGMPFDIGRVYQFQAMINGTIKATASITGHMKDTIKYHNAFGELSPPNFERKGYVRAAAKIPIP